MRALFVTLLKRLAEAAGCARLTVYEAISALEAAGLLSWCNRLKRIREWAPGLPGVGGSRVRVFRTSNGYRFNDPGQSSKSDYPSETANQAFFPLSCNVRRGGNEEDFEGENRKSWANSPT
jgi:hypothetical protein